jgi:hypothetical protein
MRLGNLSIAAISVQTAPDFADQRRKRGIGATPRIDDNRIRSTFRLSDQYQARTLDLDAVDHGPGQGTVMAASDDRDRLRIQKSTLFGAAR